MKTTTYYPSRYLPTAPVSFPNGMTRKEWLGKFLDLLLIAASGMGLAAIVVFLLVLF